MIKIRTRLDLNPEKSRLIPGQSPVWLDRQISLGANAFAFVCNQLGTELYFLTIEELNATCIVSQETCNPDSDPDLSTIPLKYHEFVDLFSKRGANKLSAH